MKLSVGDLIIFLLGLLIGTLLSAFPGSTEGEAAVLASTVDVSGIQYATDFSPTSRLDFDFRLSAESHENELRAVGFYETGRLGDYSLDLDPVVLRPRLNSSGYAWIGRAHPATEAFSGASIARTSAIGANWSQNQLDALNPRVSGWIGAGIHEKIPGTKLSVTAGYSPIFLPNFGPSLTLSSSRDSFGSRFARLPPLRVQVNDSTVLPLRYELNRGELSDIVLRNQAFFAVTHETAQASVSAMAWSAPSPDPKLDLAGAVRPTPGDVDVLVAVKPAFPRENFAALRVALPQLYSAPEVQLAHEFMSRRSAISAAATPYSGDSSRWQLGLLNTFRQVAAQDPTVPYSPGYAQWLAWTEGSLSLSRRLAAQLRYEQHLTAGEEGAWIRPGMSYEAQAHLLFFAQANLIVGQDQSYFGTWRSLDSFTLGARAVW